MEEEGLSSLFAKAFESFWKRGGFDQDASAEELESGADSLLAKLHRLAFAVEKGGMFSSNEELDDVTTADMKFLLVPFMMAEVYISSSGPEKRFTNVKSAIVFWNQFMALVESYQACDKRDMTIWLRDPKTSIPAGQKREEKIERHRRSTELNKEIKTIWETRVAKLNDPYSFDKQTKGGMDYEEEERAFLLALLRKAAMECLDHRSVGLQEVEILQMLEERKTAGPQQTTKEADSSRDPPKKPFAFTIRPRGDELRVQYRDRVFKPYHELPSISLAEVAEWEMKYGVGASSQAPSKKVDEERDSEEEEEANANEDDMTLEEIDMKERKAREWDNWADDNPRGWGNKNRNVG